MLIICSHIKSGANCCKLLTAMHTHRLGIGVKYPSTSNRGKTRTAKDVMRLSAGKREPKNPRDSSNFDEIRAHLQESDSGGLSGILNWMSRNAFGHPEPAEGMLGGLYRRFLSSQLVKSFAKGGVSRAEVIRGDSLERMRSTQVQEEASRDPRTEELATLLVCSKEDAARLAVGYPEVLDIPTEELASRMIFLRELLPRCNIAVMVAIAPRLFLECSRESLEASTILNASILKSNLEPADVGKMVEEDPDLLFRDLSGCMEKLFELWNIDDVTLRNSNPKELALAIKAMSIDGPPLKL